MANRLEFNLDPQKAKILKTIFNALLETGANKARMMVQQEMLDIVGVQNPSGILVSLVMRTPWLLEYSPNISGKDDDEPADDDQEDSKEDEDEDEDEDEGNSLDMVFDLGSLLEFFRVFEDDYWFKFKIPNLSSQPYHLKVMSSVTENNDGTSVEEMLIDIDNFKLADHTPLKQMQEYTTALLISMEGVGYVNFRRELVKAIQADDCSFRITIHKSLEVRVRHTYVGGMKFDADMWANVERFPQGREVVNVWLNYLKEARFLVPLLERAYGATLLIVTFDNAEGGWRPPLLSLKFDIDPNSPELIFVLKWDSTLRPLIRVD